MSTLATNTNKLSTFRDEDVRDPDKLRAKLNDLVGVVISTQQVRQTFVKFANIRPDASNRFSATVANPGFTVGGVALAGMRIANLEQSTPANAWSVDFVTLPGNSIQINGANAGAVVPGAVYVATFTLTEDF